MSAGFQELSLAERGGRRRDFHDLGVNTRQNLDHVKESKTGRFIFKNAVSQGYLLSTQDIELKHFILYIYFYDVFTRKKKHIWSRILHGISISALMK